ncbi:hypothetical protein J2Z60_001897 [Lactobacillus colini]|uniref:Polymerase nucleotidyl transferase domain-containing protein n=1 Tax=Lactobacillus colini TaxID=1819254 RepID=A0ABS4MGI5_9LACO|nr:hypothetical protein [Lactobacillus colini]MBP2058708.1 hypothetical protein [Lactobacillus colini]
MKVYDKYFWKMDQSGYIDNHLMLPGPPYNLILDDILELLKEQIGENLVSVFVRGSAAFNNIVLGISDLDLILGVKHKNLKTTTLIDNLCKQLSLKYKTFFCEVGIACFTDSYLGGETKSFFSKFVLKTQSVCIYGRDYSQKINRISLNQQVYKLDISFCEKKMQRFRNEVKTLNFANSEEVKSLSRHIGKYLIRTVFAILASQDQPLRYTRDVRCCFETIQQDSMIWSERLKKYYNWVACPINNLKVLDQELEIIAPLVISECNVWLETNSNV